jgi:hypothetical protein
MFKKMHTQTIAAQISSLMGGRPVHHVEQIQELWSGYGAIYRVGLGGHGPKSVVVKSVAPPSDTQHPRGWNTDLSHQRKLRSYDVERSWYLNYASQCDDTARVPRLLAEASAQGRWLFIFEDLDDAGFSARRHDATPAEIRACLTWLASFHATFLAQEPHGLWPVGTYWHLATRPEELEAIADPRLREAAPLIDARLNACTYQTLVHGDAKIANFCFPPQGGTVAGLDFQYVGGGCGIKDVAYFLSSCLAPSELDVQAAPYLDDYFEALRACAGTRLNAEALAELEAEWRALYVFAWADFYRFLAGWSPQHWKIDRYSRRLTLEALATV